MQALRLTSTWPVRSVAAAVAGPDGTVSTIGDVDRQFHLASITKLLTTWAVLVAVEEGIVALDQPVGQPGCTVRHLLAHAGGYPFDVDGPLDGTGAISAPGVRRIYSNTGIELVAATVAAAAAMPFDEYAVEAVLAPLGMTSTALRGSPAHGAWSTATDLSIFVAELRGPSLVDTSTAALMRTVQFPELAGVVPGFGRFDPCPWGLGAEIRGGKQPHWTGSANSPDTFGHFGGAGTLLWMDPQVGVSCITLTDRPFDEWSGQAKVLWPQLADAVLAELRPTMRPAGTS